MNTADCVLRYEGAANSSYDKKDGTKGTRYEGVFCSPDRMGDTIKDQYFIIGFKGEDEQKQFQATIPNKAVVRLSCWVNGRMYKNKDGGNSYFVGLTIREFKAMASNYIL